MLEDRIEGIASVDIFKKGRDESLFVGRPFSLDYEKAKILVSDAWKHRVKGIPQGAFLLAFYEGEDSVSEALLLRALTPSRLPTDNDVVSSMIEYYKEGTDISGRAGTEKASKLDDFTRYEFSFSGLECRVLGAFYKTQTTVVEDGEEKIQEGLEFGADLENFYSANNYSVYKATGGVLKKIVNQRDSEVIAGNENEFKIGQVRYSSSRRFQSQESPVEVFISPQDFIGKRTALFGMTRTGKSNTVKKLIEATAEISAKAPPKELPEVKDEKQPFSEDGAPQYRVGQIIFDVNGEYANPNLQDDGTAIFELYENQVDRYSIVDKTALGFKVLKINFYNEIQAGFKLIASGLSDQGSNYIKSFLSIDLDEPVNYKKPIGSKTSDEKNATNTYDRKVAIYKCCLSEAKFKSPSSSSTVKFYGDAGSINKIGNCSTPPKKVCEEGKKVLI